MKWMLMMALLLVASSAGAKETSWSQTWTSDSDHKDFAYGLVETTERGGNLSLTGTEDDKADLMRQRERTDGAFVWLRSGSKRYLVTDPATVARAQEILAPELEISRNQSKLGDAHAGEAGRRKEVYAAVRSQMKGLLDQAIASGAARRI